MFPRRYLHAAAADGSTGGESQTTGQTTGQSQQAAAVTQAEWFVSEGIKGTGPAPDWYDGKKYKTVYDQAKARRDAETLLGTQTTQIKDLQGKLTATEAKLPKAPETYAFSLPDQYKDSFEIKTDDPSLSKLTEAAKKHGLSQEAFNDVFGIGMELIANYELADPNQEKTLIGENADARMKTVLDWAKANVPADAQDAFNRALGVWSRPSDVFKVIESIIVGKREPGLPGNAAVDSAPTIEAINKKYRTPDATTKKALIDTPEGREAYRNELRQVVGDGEHQVIRGKR